MENDFSDRKKLQLFEDHEPKIIRVVRFAENRSREITCLENEMKAAKSNKHFFQSLPKHMRRRAMSYNVKRLPRKMQQFIKKEAHNIGLASTSKRPSRKYRRRPSKILNNFARRKKTYIWLETHLWHAKRFKIEPLWGYKIPIHSHDKSSRATYRAVSEHALLQDISYYNCIELSGSQQILLNGLTNLTSPETGLTFAAKSYLSGSKEGSLILYHSEKYPHEAIGPVTFLWKPVDDANSERHLWLWCHPACHEEIISELKIIFKLTDQDTSQCTNSDQIPKLSCYSNNFVRLLILKDSLVRFRLSGPKAYNILKEVFHLPCITDLSQRKWWSKFCCNDNYRNMFEKQSQYWEEIKSMYMSNEIGSGSVIGLIVRDPRVFIPHFKEMAEVSNIEDNKVFNDPSSLVSFSPLWNTFVRDEVTSDKMSQNDFNKKRQELLVPGSQVELGQEENLIPLILISRTGQQYNSVLKVKRKSLGFGSGWDIILPQSWAMPFWIALIYRGARVGGLREALDICKYTGTQFFPDDYVDTKSGIEWNNLIQNQLDTKYEKIPPAKKPNYQKLGVLFPFHFPWLNLVKEWDSTVKEDNVLKEFYHKVNIKEYISLNNYYIVRCKKMLYFLNQLCNSKSSLPIDDSLTLTNLEMTIPLHGLIFVEITMKKGLSLKFATICLPINDDLKKLQTKLSFAGPVESVHKTLTSKKRKHPEEATHTESLPLLIKDSCSRKIIGFVTNGSYAYSEGRSIGIGLCSLSGFVKLCSQNEKTPVYALIRNATSFQYRFCQLNVII